MENIENIILTNAKPTTTLNIVIFVIAIILAVVLTIILANLLSEIKEVILATCFGIILAIVVLFILHLDDKGIGDETANIVAEAVNNNEDLVAEKGEDGIIFIKDIKTNKIISFINGNYTVAFGDIVKK